MSVEQAVAYALEREAPAGPPSVRQAEASSHHSRSTLTRRELEVAALIADGRTNREIAAGLVIALSTAERHVANILKKLRLRTRGQIAVWTVTNVRGVLLR
jgi:non-specific serine/threonine protein kinase